MLIGGPVADAAYRRARRALGLADTAVAPRERVPAARGTDRPTRAALSGPAASVT
jgi:hypothetical protein